LETYLNLEFEAGKPVNGDVMDDLGAIEDSVSSHLSQPYITAADFDED